MDDDLRIALQVVDVADAITMKHFGRDKTRVRTKRDGSLVSDADLVTEQAVRGALAQLCPEDGVVGEEFDATGLRASRRWIVDPIDHTKNYIRGIPVFATMLALEVDGSVQIGVVSAPAMNKRWYASRTKGAYERDAGTALRVSGVGELADAYLSFASLPGWVRRGRLAAVAELVAQCRAGFGSGGFWSHMLVAEGRMDISLDPSSQLWDLAAVSVIVEEAGGRMTDLEGKAGPAGGCGVVTNGLLHGRVLSALSRRNEVGHGD